jgi:hypothetical protein
MAIDVAKGVTVDDTAFIKHLEAYSKVMGKSMGEVAQQQAGLFCKDMIGYSRPFDKKNNKGSGATSAAKSFGESNVANSIRKIFRPIEKATKAQIADINRYDVFKMWNKRKGESGQTKRHWKQFQPKFFKGGSYTFIEPGQLGAMGALHKRLRTDDGRGSLTDEARNAKQPFAIVAKDSDIQKYIKQKQKDVGYLKSAYWFASQSIGAKITAPAWVKKSDAARNAISIKEGQGTPAPSFTVGNLIGRRAGNSAFVRAAINHRAYAMRTVMAAKLNKDKVKLWQACASGTVTNIAEGFTA